MLDLSIPKLLVLAILAIVIFGPDQLPKVAAQAGRMLREVRRLADGARNDLAEGLGPEFSDLDLRDLHPRTFVRKHLLEGLDLDGMDGEPVTGSEPATATAPAQAPLPPGESPPYDFEAT